MTIPRYPPTRDPINSTEGLIKTHDVHENLTCLSLFFLTIILKERYLLVSDRAYRIYRLGSW